MRVHGPSARLLEERGSRGAHNHRTHTEAPPLHLTPAPGPREDMQFTRSSKTLNVVQGCRDAALPLIHAAAAVSRLLVYMIDMIYDFMIDCHSGARFSASLEVITVIHVHVEWLKMWTSGPRTRSAIKHVHKCTGSLASPLQGVLGCL
jgi:hypothetical protein